jgi:hypothetical protein
MKKLLNRVVLILIVLFVIAQFIQPDRSNPPVDAAATFQAVAKPAPEIATVVERACRDCHTNQTVWPWWAHVTPVSWMVARDVREGRTRLNFSRWDIYSTETSRIRLLEACSMMKAHKMPLPHYVLLHPSAKLTEKEIDGFCAAAEK